MSETILTLTLPARNESGTLVVRRGDIGHMAHFVYTTLADLPEIIGEALSTLSALEEHPPKISDIAPPATPSAKQPVTARKSSSSPATPDSEPTIDIPLKKGQKTIRISHLRIVAGDTDAAAYAVAVKIAAKLIGGKLWDGSTPIRLEHVYALEKRMRSLDDSDMALYALADFTAA